MNRDEAAALFDGWDEALIWSCLQGHMGTLVMSADGEPNAACVSIGDFCFFAGEPTAALLNTAHGRQLLVPQNDAWAALIEQFFGGRAKRFLRYAIKKEPDVFDRQRLAAFAGALGSDYTLRAFDAEIFKLARAEAWSSDLCAQFSDFEDYRRRGIGAVILQGGTLVAGASPYAVYDGGIEIEIDTRPACRHRGLATVCGAKLILDCLARGLYPSWDAHNLHSLALAEKLGYHLSHPYPTYELTGGADTARPCPGPERQRGIEDEN